jgi:hypothetical protein
MNRRRAIAVGLTIGLLISTTGRAQNVDDPDYEQGYQSWTAEKYPDAATTLRRFRAKPYGERFEVDYWIGTSWCRMPGEEASGWDLLEWAMYAYPLSPDTRATFKVERDICREAAGAANARPKVVVVKATGTGATARAEQTKLFYMPGGKRGALRAYAPKTKREIPVATFDARLVPLSDPERALAVVRSQAPDAKVVRTGSFVIASKSGHSSEQLERIGSQLDAYLAFLKRQYELVPPTYFITIYLLPQPKLVRKYAERLHGLDVSEATLGYAFQNDLSVIALLKGEGAGTLLHEIFHLAARSNYGAIPQWMDEGIASLYETCTRVGDRFMGEPNWRAIVLNFHSRRSGLPSLKDVITSRWFWDDVSVQPGADGEVWDMESQAYMMALARYFALFLQEQGKLATVYRAYRERRPAPGFVAADVQAVRLVEEAVRQPIHRIEADFWSWYETVRNPEARLHAGEAVQKELDRDLPNEN